MLQPSASLCILVNGQIKHKLTQPKPEIQDLPVTMATDVIIFGVLPHKLSSVKFPKPSAALHVLCQQALAEPCVKLGSKYRQCRSMAYNCAILLSMKLVTCLGMNQIFFLLLERVRYSNEFNNLIMKKACLKTTGHSWTGYFSRTV